MYRSFVNQFAEYSDEKLIKLIATERNKPGWTNTRATYLLALRHVVNSKGLGQTIIGKEKINNTAK